MRKNTKLREVRALATLDLSIQSDNANQSEVNEWEIDGAIYARMLYHPNCPEVFKKAFVNIFLEHLLRPCVEEGVHEIAQLFPLAVLALQGWIPADANRTVQILTTLRETLAADFYEEIKDSMKLDGVSDE